MPSLHLNLDFTDQLKVRRLVLILGKNAEIIPIRLWLFCGKVCPMNGVLLGYSEKEIERIVQWGGEKGKCFKALVDLKFLDQIEGGVRVHDWKDHAGHLKSYSIRGQKARLAQIIKKEMPERKNEEVF